MCYAYSKVWLTDSDFVVMSEARPATDL